MRPGIVAVIQSASDSAHYPAFNRGTYDQVAIPWLRLEFYDETELGLLLSQPLERRFAAVIFTPGAIALPAVRETLAHRADTLAEALAHGVGIVVGATSLGGVERFDLTFLPEGSQISLLQTRMRGMAGLVQVTGLLERLLPETEGRQAPSGVTVAASHAFGWMEAATLTAPDGTVEIVTWRAQFGRGRVVVTVLPFDRLGWHEVIRLMLTRVTRSRSCLVLGRDTPPHWFEEVADGEALVRLPRPGADLDTLDRLLDSFAMLRLCRDVTWADVGCLTRQALLARLENDGTVEFAAYGPDKEIYCRLAGVPHYLLRLRQAQADLIDVVAGIHTSPTFHALAVAVLSKTAEYVVQDPLFVPGLLRTDTVRSIVEAAVARRVNDGSVDGLLLPTINLLAAASITGSAPEAVASMVTWIKNNAPGSSPDHLAQARWVARAAARADLLDFIPEPAGQPASLLGRLSQELDAGQLGPLPAAAGPLDTAIIAYTYARWSPSDQAPAIWSLLNGTDDPLSAKSPRASRNVEELCYRTAAEALLDAASPLAVHPVTAAGPAQIPPRASELLSRQAAIEMDARQGQQAVEDLGKVIGATRAMAGTLAALLMASAIAVISLPFWLPQLKTAGAGVQISLSTAAFVVVSTLLTLASTTRAAELAAPKWAQAAGVLVRALGRK